MKKILVFLFQETPTLTISFLREAGLEWYCRLGEMSLFDKLILGVCLLRPVFFSDVLSDVINVTTKYSALQSIDNRIYNSRLNNPHQQRIRKCHKNYNPKKWRTLQKTSCYWAEE